MKKCFDSKELALSAMNYHNAQADKHGWKIMKSVYFCPNHQAWHLTAMSDGDVRNVLRFEKSLEKSGSKILQRIQARFDHHMEICKNKLLLPDGTYRQPDAESHKELMISLVGFKKWPVKFKYVEMWWSRLPEHQKHKPSETTTITHT
jgi:hypothetical protein